MALLWEDYVKLRNLKNGETAICSDGVERGRVAMTDFGDSDGYKDMTMIPYGINDTCDNR